ncbi:MAG: right-handed parallel beta-helix repeat-containing protein, partial [Myxococcales bacterium]|nr:right-handed parallel beta-helix repeat-containing protein [Myxococcales bacterium]
HHILVENLDLSGFDADQQIVGISTKTPAHNWVIRGNRIAGAGTGLYLGNSDGSLPFYAGVIEFNSVSSTLGYSMQIKHQLSRPSDVPDGAETLIRYNVFSKGSESSSGGNARPNLLLGHQPLSGSGSGDRFVVYSNFLYDNPTEMLFQAEGNLVVFNNLFVNPSGGGVNIQPHNATPRQVDVFFNTIVTNGVGLRISGGDSAFTQQAFGNASFGRQPFSVGTAQDNVEGTLAEAAQVFVGANTLDLSTLDLHPQGNALVGASIPTSAMPSGVDASHDFDEVTRDFTRRGAYAGAPPSGAWKPSLEPRSY